MESMEHLFREYEMKEQEVAGIRTGRFKTALDRAEKAQYILCLAACYATPG